MHYCHIVQGTRHKPQWNKTERGSNVSKSSTKELKRAGNFQCEREFRFNITARAVKSRLRLLWGKVVGPAVQIQNIPDILVMKRSRSTHSTMTRFLQQSWKFMMPYINTVNGLSDVISGLSGMFSSQLGMSVFAAGVC